MRWWLNFSSSCSLYMAGIYPIRRKTQNNQSILFSYISKAVKFFTLNRGEQILSLTVITILGFGYSQITAVNGWNIADTAQNTIQSINQSINKTKIMPIWDFSISLCLVGDIRRLHVLFSLHLVFPVVLGSKEETFFGIIFLNSIRRRFEKTRGECHGKAVSIHRKVILKRL